MFSFTRTAQTAGTCVTVHAAPTLQLIVRGQSTTVVERRRYPLGPGCVLFRPAGVRAAETVHEDGECFLIEVPEAYALVEVVAETTARPGRSICFTSSKRARLPGRVWPRD